MTETIEQAFKLAGQPVKRGSMAHDHDMYMMLADAAAQTQDATACRAYAARLEELAERDGHKLYLAIAHRAWGVAHRLSGEHGEAETRLNCALEIFRDLGTRWQIGRTLVELAHLARARATRDAARDLFAHALAIFEALRAQPDAERTRAAIAMLSKDQAS
ncbi:MAG: hypothetical protein HZC40_05175 [Chloroflexi bacterium]|nr:hypothetical protein [Chloroflexota bacterium]